jgi:choline dehydrogenase
VDLPGVGQNLQDHPNVSLFFKGKQESDCSWAQLYGFHRVATRSHLQAGQADTCYVFYSARSSFREGVIRLLPLMMLPLFLYKVATLVRLLRALIKAVFSVGLLQRFVARMWGVVVILGKPKSRGRLWLQSTDPAQQAAIDPNYFGDPEDLETLLNGVQRAQQLAATEAMQKWGNKALIPGGGTRTRLAVAKWVRKNVMTTYHYAGTCKMGLDEDPLAVVDVQLRVRGVRGLRVADASVIPSVPVSAMNAPSMVIGYRAAQLVKQAQQSSEEEAA